MSKSKKIVCLGAGTGQAAVLAGLKKYDLDLCGIVNVTDNGGSSAQIRRSMNLPQPGDSRNVLTSVAKPDNVISQLFKYRFTEGELAGVSLGNYIIAALARITGDFGQAIETAAEILQIPGQVLPASTTSTNVCAELADGQKICGEWEIIARKNKTKIRKIFLEHRAPAYPLAIEKIKQADLVIIGPGSLHTGIIPNLLMTGMAKAINTAKAIKVYICNIMTQPGLTDDYKTSDHIKAIESYLETKLDYVIVNNGRIPAKILKAYQADGSLPVEIDDGVSRRTKLIKLDLVNRSSLEETLKDRRVFGKKSDFSKMAVWKHWIRHDSLKLAKTLVKLLN